MLKIVIPFQHSFLFLPVEFNILWLQSGNIYNDILFTTTTTMVMIKMITRRKECNNILSITTVLTCAKERSRTANQANLGRSTWSLSNPCLQRRRRRRRIQVTLQGQFGKPFASNLPSKRQFNSLYHAEIYLLYYFCIHHHHSRFSVNEE